MEQCHSFPPGMWNRNRTWVVVGVQILVPLGLQAIEYTIHNTMNYYMLVVVLLIKGIDRSEIIGNVLTTMGDNHNHIER